MIFFVYACMTRFKCKVEDLKKKKSLKSEIKTKKKRNETSVFCYKK